jgi:hypothetical protein
MLGMGRKSTAKQHSTGAPPPEKPKGGNMVPVILGAIVVVVGIAFFVSRKGEEPAAQVTSRNSSMPMDARPYEETAEALAAAQAVAALGPHKQDNLPPIPIRGYAPPRPPEVVTAAYQFAAEHPEVLTYIPCFCGCQRSGHHGNGDCFVKARAVNGDVTEWDEHGVECGVCIDVATRARQMHASGASVRDIRAAVDKEFASHFESKTPTPHPPARDH